MTKRGRRSRECNETLPLPNLAVTMRSSTPTSQRSSNVCKQKLGYYFANRQHLQSGHAALTTELAADIRSTALREERDLGNLIDNVFREKAASYKSKGYDFKHERDLVGTHQNKAKADFKDVTHNYHMELKFAKRIDACSQMQQTAVEQLKAYSGSVSRCIRQQRTRAKACMEPAERQAKLAPLHRKRIDVVYVRKDA